MAACSESTNQFSIYLRAVHYVYKRRERERSTYSRISTLVEDCTCDSTDIHAYVCTPRQLGNGRFNTSDRIRTGQGGAGIHDFATAGRWRKEARKWSRKKEQIGETRENQQEPGKTLLIGAASSIPLLPSHRLSRFLFPISLLSPFFSFRLYETIFDKIKTKRREERWQSHGDVYFPINIYLVRENVSREGRKET